MLQRFVRLAAVLMICMPIGDALHPGWLARAGLSWGPLTAQWWLGPREMLVCAGCVLVLFLTDYRRRRAELDGAPVR